MKSPLHGHDGDTRDPAADELAPVTRGCRTHEMRNVVVSNDEFRLDLLGKATQARAENNANLGRAVPVTPNLVGRLGSLQCQGQHCSATMPVIKVRNLGSAPRAMAMISSTLTGCNASGRQTSVTTENAMTRSPQCAATMTSGTVDMPTTSAPIIRKKRYSARVSRLGPVTATNTP